MTFLPSQSLVNFPVTQWLARRISHQTSCLFVSSRLEVASARNFQHCDHPHEIQLIRNFSWQEAGSGSLQLSQGRGLIGVGMFGSGASPR